MHICLAATARGAHGSQCPVAARCTTRLTCFHVRLPAGNIYAMQRNPAYWPQPEAFIPERFLPGAPEAEGVNLDAWMPFGEVRLNAWVLELPVQVPAGNSGGKGLGGR